MLRDKLLHHEPVDGFRWRSHEITRVEGFSDAVFGFAVTLLIAPRSRPAILAAPPELLRDHDLDAPILLPSLGVIRAIGLCVRSDRFLRAEARG